MQRVFRHWLLAGCAWLLAASAPLTGARGGAQEAAVPAPAPTVRATLNRYCLSCHNDRLRTGGLSLAALDPSAVGGHADIWERVVRKLRTHEMPPTGLPRPDDSTYRATAEALERALDAEAERHPQPGRVAVHRLSRTEYANAVRDLLGIDVPAPRCCPRTNRTSRPSTTWRACCRCRRRCSKTICRRPIASAGSRWPIHRRRRRRGLHRTAGALAGRARERRPAVRHAGRPRLPPSVPGGGRVP